jgi:hypothetical protein
MTVSDQTMLARHFTVMHRVASEVPFSQVTMPDDFSALPAVREAIFADFRGH